MIRSRNSIRRESPRHSGGLTIVELLVAIVALGMMAAVVVGVPWRAQAAADSGDEKDRSVAAINSARDQALAAGAAVTRVVRVGSETLVITALPDGRVIGADRQGFDRLSGKPTRSPGVYSVSDRGGWEIVGGATATVDTARHREPR